MKKSISPSNLNYSRNCHRFALLLTAANLVLASSSAVAQLAYEGSLQGTEYKVYVTQKRKLADRRYEFTTGDGKWEIADCRKNTINGKPVRFGYPVDFGGGEDYILNVVCGRSREWGRDGRQWWMR